MAVHAIAGLRGQAGICLTLKLMAVARNGKVRRNKHMVSAGLRRECGWHRWYESRSAVAYGPDHVADAGDGETAGCSWHRRPRWSGALRGLPVGRDGSQSHPGVRLAEISRESHLVTFTLLMVVT